MDRINRLRTPLALRPSFVWAFYAWLLPYPSATWASDYNAFMYMSFASFLAVFQMIHFTHVAKRRAQLGEQDCPDGESFASSATSAAMEPPEERSRRRIDSLVAILPPLGLDSACVIRPPLDGGTAIASVVAMGFSLGKLISLYELGTFISLWLIWICALSQAYMLIFKNSRCRHDLLLSISVYSIDPEDVFDASFDSLKGGVRCADALALAPRTCARLALVVVSGCAMRAAGWGNPYVIALVMLGSVLSFVGSANLEMMVFATRSPSDSESILRIHSRQGIRPDDRPR